MQCHCVFNCLPENTSPVFTAGAAAATAAAADAAVVAASESRQINTIILRNAWKQTQAS